METPEFLAMIDWIVLTLVVFFNLRDSHRIWLVAIMLAVKALDLLVNPHLPRDVFTPQLFYISLDLLVIAAVLFRFPICRWLSNKAKGNRTSSPSILAKLGEVLRRFAVTGRLVAILDDRSLTKQELAICFLYAVSITVNVLAIVEHVFRHPEFLGFAAWETIPDSLMYLYNSYAGIKAGLLALVVFTLFTMTVDGMVLRVIERRKLSKRS